MVVVDAGVPRLLARTEEVAPEVVVPETRKPFACHLCLPGQYRYTQEPEDPEDLEDLQVQDLTERPELMAMNLFLVSSTSTVITMD